MSDDHRKPPMNAAESKNRDVAALHVRTNHKLPRQGRGGA